jgi:hypothetical protein
MAQMCRFLIPGEAEAISVNPLLVRYLRPNADGYTTIFFDDHHKLVVNAPLFKVEESLNAALNR